MSDVAEVRSRHFTPGAFGLSGGVPPVLGAGRQLPDFHVMPGESAFVGITPYLHSHHQLQALWHAEDSAGFDNETVTFMVHWFWFKPSRVTVSIDQTGITGWVQEKAEEK
jgi:hypothetical protein